MKYLRLIATLDVDNRLVLYPGYLTDSPRHAVSDDASPVQIEIARDASVLLRWGATRIRAAGHRSRDPEDAWLIMTKVPFAEGANRVTIMNRGVIVGTMELPARGPTFERPLRLESGERGWQCSWKSSHPLGLAIRHYLRMSADGGRSWCRLISNLEANEVILRREMLVGGPECLVECVAHDGFHTSRSSVIVRDARQAELVARVIPHEVDLTNGDTVILRGFSHVLGRWQRVNDGIDLAWYQGEKRLGTGTLLTFRATAAGTFDIELRATAMKESKLARCRIRVR